MKDPNFDYIKDKFDSCGVNAPEALSEQAVLEQIPDRPVQETPKKRNTRLIAGVSAAAVLAVVTAGAITFTSLFNQQPAVKQAASQSVSLRPFASREELREELTKIRKIVGNANNNYAVREDMVFGNAEMGAAGGSLPSSLGASSSHNSTYVQTVGVDEADIVKTSDTHIFYLSYNNIHIFSAEGQASREVGTVVSGEKYSLMDFYLVGDRLVTLGDDMSTSNTNPAYGYVRNCVARVYDISDVTAPRQLGSFWQSGYYLSSRMIDDTLYMVSTQYVSDPDDIPQTSGSQNATADSATMDEVPVSDIYAVETPVTSQYLVVSSIDTKNGAQATKTKAILGSADIIYCNRDNLFVTAQEFSPSMYQNIFNSVETGYYWDYRSADTQIIKISLEKDIDFVADGKVPGVVDNQYALDEYNGNLRVATTSLNDDDYEVNNLYVLDGNLQQIGAVTGFAPTESIKAVRYINETAYVITYEQTDPLFVIDVSEPTAPAILGEVKISGFSTMLVPVDDNTLLGIGYHTQSNLETIDMEVQDGLKIVTFDVSDKAHPKVIDAEVYPDYYSDVQYNPKALLVNFERGDYTIPMSSYQYMESDEKWLNYNEALNFRVDNGEIKVVDRYRSERFNSENDCLERCVYVGNTIYLLGVNYLETGDDFEPKAIIDCVDYK